MSNKPTLASIMHQLPVGVLHSVDEDATHITVDNNGDVFTWYAEPQFRQSSVTRSNSVWLGAVDRYIGTTQSRVDAEVCIWELHK